MRDLNTVFSELYSIGIEGEVNEIVIALPQPRYQSATEDKKSVGALKTLFQSSVVKLQKLRVKVILGTPPLICANL